MHGTNVNAIVLAAQVLAHLGDEARVALPRLSELLSHEDARVRVRTAKALWRLDGQNEAVLPILLTVLREERIRTTTATPWAMKTLGEMGPAAKDAVPLLETMLLRQQTGLRKLAEEALSRIAGRPE